MRIHVIGDGAIHAALDIFEEAAELTRRRMEEGLSPTMAAKEVARATGYKKGDLYRAALEASGEEE